MLSRRHQKPHLWRANREFEQVASASECGMLVVLGNFLHLAAGN